MGARKKPLKPPAVPPQQPADKEALPASYDFENCVTRMRKNYFAPDVIAAINFTEANIFEISKLLGRTRTSVRDYIFANLEVKNAYDEMREIMLDKAEQALFETGLIMRDPATLRFICSTLGRERGYTPEIKHTGADGGPLQFNLVLNTDGATPSVLEQKTELELPLFQNGDDDAPV